MLKMFYPYEYVESVFDIDYERLYSLGYKAIIFDIDNTLVHHGDNSNRAIDNLFLQIHNIGLKTLLLSNNCKERIESFLINIESLYIAEADKPKPDNYYKAIELLGCKKEEAIFVGDQLFTDIYGANKCGMANILVKFLRRSDETKIGKKRMLEKYILLLYKHSKTYQHRLGNITRKGNTVKDAVESK